MNTKQQWTEWKQTAQIYAGVLVLSALTAGVRLGWWWVERFVIP